MTKELTVTPNKEIIAVGNRIDEIVNECLPVAAQENQNFVQALTLANGIKALRQIFLNDPHIKETIQAMQNTHLGFMTDRTPAAIYKARQGSKELKPYRYEETVEVCIEAMLKGYRMTNNEFNMLVGRFYAAKNGKFRRIQECEGVTDFQFTTTSPAYEPIQGGVQYAKVQGFASWRKDGQLATLGSSTAAEDKLIFKIRVNKQMGEDAIVGKALSKLFSRVLMRLEGKIMPEATDVSEEDIVEGEIETETTSDLADKIKEKAKEMDQKEEASQDDKVDTTEAIAAYKKAHPVSKTEPPPDTEKSGAGGSEKKEGETKSQEDLKAAMKKQDDLMTHGIDPAISKAFYDATNGSDAYIFWRMRETGLALFFDTFEGEMNGWPKEIQGFVMAKCKNIAGKHPEFMDRLEAAMAKKAETEDQDTASKKDETEDWNGLKQCPRMNDMNIPKVKCKECEDRSTCSAWKRETEQF